MIAVAEREILQYRKRNKRHAQYTPKERFVIGAVKLSRLPVMMAFSELKAIITKADGTVLDLGVISRRVVTTVGVTYLADGHMNTVEPEALNYHEMGTGAVAEAVGDTTLTAVETRATGTQSKPAANQYRSVGTITATAARSVTEHGLFSASTAGTLFDRSVFAVITLAIGDSIQFTYTLTYTSGG